MGWGGYSSDETNRCAHTLHALKLCLHSPAFSLTSAPPALPLAPSPRQGGYRACNRMGIESSTSPFLKITFETAAQFLIRATLHGDVDPLTSPASRIVLGRPVGVGSGACELVQRVQLKAAGGGGREGGGEAWATPGH